MALEAATSHHAGTSSANTSINEEASVLAEDLHQSLSSWGLVGALRLESLTKLMEEVQPISSVG